MFGNVTKFLVNSYCNYHQALTRNVKSKFHHLYLNTSNDNSKAWSAPNRSILGIAGDILRQPALNFEHRTSLISLKPTVLGKYVRNVEIKQTEKKISFDTAGKIRKYTSSNGSSADTDKVGRCYKAKPCKKLRKRRKPSDVCKKSPETKEKVTVKRASPCVPKKVEEEEGGKACCPKKGACKSKITCSKTDTTKDRCKKAVACKKKDSCVKKGDLCKRKREDPCKPKEICPAGKCTKKVDPCKVVRGDPCIRKEDDCK